MEEENLDELAEKVADLIIGAKKLVVFSGAGISTESGIPDFRSPAASGAALTPKTSPIRSSSPTPRPGESSDGCWGRGI